MSPEDAKQAAIAALEQQAADLTARITELTNELEDTPDIQEKGQIAEELAAANQDRQAVLDKLEDLRRQAVRVDELTDTERADLEQAISERADLEQAISDLNPEVQADQALHARLDAAESVLNLIKPKG